MVCAVFSKVYCSTSCSCSIIYVCQLFPCRTTPILSAMNAFLLFSFSIGHYYITLLICKNIMAEFKPESPLSLDARGTHLLHSVQEKTQATSSKSGMCNC